jgi:CheY-like chemotaxis protein
VRASRTDIREISHRGLFIARPAPEPDRRHHGNDALPDSATKMRCVMTIRLSPLTSVLILRNTTMKLRLLATDPDPVLLQIYRSYFSSFGFEVATAEEGLECVALLRNFAPDALVLSLELTWGGADGVLSIVRDEGQMRPIPVVLTVGESSRSKAVKYLVPPVVKLLEKPFRLRDLRAIVESVLRARAERLSARVAGAPAASDDARPAHDPGTLTPHIHRGETRHV